MDEDKKKALTLKVLKRRFLTEAGIDVENLSIEDLAIKIYQLEQAFEELQTKKKKITPKRFVELVLSSFVFTKGQKALLRSLSSMRPVSDKDLKEKTGSKSIKYLVKDTNKTLKSYEEDQKSDLRTLYISKIRSKIPDHYQLFQFVRVKKIVRSKYSLENPPIG